MLNKVDDYLWKVLVKNSIGWLREESLEEELIIAMNDFITNKIDEGILKIRINLMRPILKNRKKKDF